MVLEEIEETKKVSEENICDQNLVSYILQMLQTWMDAVFEIKRCLEKKEVEKGKLIGFDLKEALQTTKEVVELEGTDYLKEFAVRCENCLESLKRILSNMKKAEIEIAESKLEFELFPLFRIAYVRLYYGIIEGNKEKEEKFWEEEAVELCKNYYIEKGMKTGTYKYDLTVYVLSYNNLEYTKICVESVLENLPRTIRCELILINHGSTDGTKEYFEMIQPEKQIDIKINGLEGFAIVPFIAEGEFILSISNDVIITTNAINLMLECIKEDPQVACVVPTTPNIENLQSVWLEEFQFKTIGDLKRETKRYNRRERKKEENRIRLLTPLFMVRSEYWVNSQKTKAFVRTFLDMKTAMFGDDALSLCFRRAGYKNILMKDVYCYHYGSKTFGKTGHDFLSGRKLFYEKYGVDAWEKGVCWSHLLFQTLICDKVDAKRILGVNGGMGGNPLKIKEELKERVGNTQVRLINYTMQKRFLLDLQGVSDEAYYVKDWQKLFQSLNGKFDYIFLAGGLEENQDYQEHVKRFYKYLIKGGIIILQSAKKSQIDWFEEYYEKVKRVEDFEMLFCKDERQIQYYAFCKKEEENN